MRIQSLAVIAVATAFSFTTPVMVKAQQPEQEKKEGQQQDGMMSMDNMMKECRQHCQRTRESAANLEKTLEDAKQSNDPAKMRSAIEQAQKPLAAMQSHMNMCMNMMGMHGKGGMMQGGQGEQKKRDKQP
ncbi:MAG TPA: hypothetical protein VN442_10230 [Bryobacteraceae bacterium]|nr:hypothetical protein [Bryobacteraceae bacterium]